MGKIRNVAKIIMKYYKRSCNLGLYKLFRGVLGLLSFANVYKSSHYLIEQHVFSYHGTDTATNMCKPFAPPHTNTDVLSASAEVMHQRT